MIKFGDVIFFAVCCTASFLIGVKFTGSYYQHGIIERGYGLYCPDNSEFAFVGECNTDE